MEAESAGFVEHGFADVEAVFLEAAVDVEDVEDDDDAEGVDGGVVFGEAKHLVFADFLDAGGDAGGVGVHISEDVGGVGLALEEGFGDGGGEGGTEVVEAEKGLAATVGELHLAAANADELLEEGGDFVGNGFVFVGDAQEHAGAVGDVGREVGGHDLAEEGGDFVLDDVELLFAVEDVVFEGFVGLAGENETEVVEELPATVGHVLDLFAGLFDGDDGGDLEGVEEGEAGEFARRALLAVCEWNPAGPCSVSGEWGDEIGLSIVRTLPAVFDWVYELLSAKERNWAAATLRQHARQVYELLTNGNYAGNAGRSHSGRLPAYLGELALVLHGMIPEEECERYLAYALDLYGSIFPHYGGRDGGWAEGVFYASSYTKWYLPFFFAVERLSGFSFFAKPFYRHVAEFFLHFAVPGMKCHPFGDGHWDTRTEWPGFQAQNPFGVYADRFGPELARNFSRRCDEAIDHYELHLLDVIVPPPRAKLRELPRIGSDRSYVSPDTGLASLHTDLAHPERDIAVYARASRYGTPSHQHADQGDFAILAGGRGLIVPSGSFGYQFGEPHHRVWTQQTVSANCVLIDGNGQKKESAEATARMEPELEKGEVSRLKLHLEPAYPMLRRYLRTLEFNHETGVLTVTDEIEADHPVVVDWRLHSNLPPKREGEAFRIVDGGCSVRFVVAGPEEADYTVGDRYSYPNGTGGEIVPGRERARQFHMNWRFAPHRKLAVRAEFHIFAEEEGRGGC